MDDNRIFNPPVSNQWRVNLRDVRKRVKAERAYHRRDEVQQCTVCGRLFVKRRDNVCSMRCKAEAEQEGRHL